MSPDDRSLADIHAIALKERAESQIPHHQKKVEGFTALLGRPRTLFAVLVMASLWIVANVALHLIKPTSAFDPPPFFWLQGAAGLGGLLTTTLILITQNRQNRHAEERAALDLEVNLSAELKITKLISLLEELRRDLPIVRDRVDLQADAMKKAVDPHAILSVIESKNSAE